MCFLNVGVERADLSCLAPQSKNGISAKEDIMAVLRKLLMAGVCVLACCFWVADSAHAAYPEKPVVLVVGYAAGGSTDLPARAFASVFSKTLGQTVVVKNVAGASGVAGNTEVAFANPDGYTVLFGPSGPMVMYPNIQKMPYPDDAFIPVCRVVQDNTVLFTPKNAPWTDYKSMVEIIKKNPGKYRYATSGANNPAHMANLLLFRELGLKVGHLPSNGGAGCVQAMNAGNAHFYADMPPVGKTYDLRPLGVYSSERLPHAPHIPTFKEQGANPPDTYVWQGLFVPKGTPQEVVDTLAAAAKKAVESEECKELFAKLETVGAYMPPEEFAKFYKEEGRHWRDIYIKAGVIKQ